MRVQFLVVLLVLPGVTACSKRDASQEQAARSDSAVVATNENVSPVVVREAGVRFDPPSTWPSERYRVASRAGRAAAEDQPGAAHSVAIHYRPDQPGHEEALLCRIVVFARDDWSRIDAGPHPPVGTLIENADEWAFIAQLPQSNPYPRDSLDGAQFEAMRLSIREMRARFSVEGEGPSKPDAGDL
ncbi:MAG: hypothetical protein L0Z51_06140 [Candidatus Latescibacteria bacterium]|nr:hypothetical protein [Candidatus Latescibacterota bacterium]